MPKLISKREEPKDLNEIKYNLKKKKGGGGGGGGLRAKHGLRIEGLI